MHRWKRLKNRFDEGIMGVTPQAKGSGNAIFPYFLSPNIFKFKKNVYFCVRNNERTKRLPRFHPPSGDDGAIRTTEAQVAELVDALVSGASGFAIVQVRVLFWAQRGVIDGDGSPLFFPATKKTAHPKTIVHKKGTKSDNFSQKCYIRGKIVNRKNN